jgi:hypothetical protein
VDLGQLKQYADLVQAAVVIFGIPSAIYTFRRERRKDREEKQKERTAQAFQILQQIEGRFLDFVRMSLEHIELDVSDFPVADFPDVNKRRELMTLEALLLTMEHAFLLYHDGPAQFRNEAWPAWETYIQKWAARKNFVEAWHLTSDAWEPTFCDYMKKIVPDKDVPLTPESTAAVSHTVSTGAASNAS